MTSLAMENSVDLASICVLSRVMYMDCFWLSLSLLEERIQWGGGMFQETHELSDVFHWHRLQKKPKQNIVVLFVLSFGQAGCQTGP